MSSLKLSMVGDDVLVLCLSFVFCFFVQSVYVCSGVFSIFVPINLTYLYFIITRIIEKNITETKVINT